MIYKYVWQTCQQSLKIISIEQPFVREITLFLNCVVPENTHTPTPHGGQKFQGEGGPKGVNFRGVGGLFTVAYRGFFQVV